MGKLLRVLVFVFLIFSIGALVLGWMLFDKRELLKGRTQKLEAAFVELSATNEDEPINRRTGEDTLGCQAAGASV